ncbi:hypothetical protein KW797_04465 [Candidatus Parcubacteria bacterium]|nr:hypothetical protein [Candidatus Parcubacteria bacterium]
MIALYLFLFSGLLFSSMVAFRIWELRAGRFNLKEVAARELTVSGAHLEHLNNKFLNFLRYAAHFIMVLAVRTLIGLLFVVRRESRRLATKLDHLFLAPHGFPAENPASYFLQDILEYKERLRSIAAPEKREEEI